MGTVAQVVERTLNLSTASGGTSNDFKLVITSSKAMAFKEENIAITLFITADKKVQYDAQI